MTEKALLSTEVRIYVPKSKLNIYNNFRPKVVKIPLSENGKLHLSSINSVFKNVEGLSFIDSTGCQNIVLYDEQDKSFITPKDGWDDKTFEMSFSVDVVTSSNQSSWNTSNIACVLLVILIICFCVFFTGANQTKDLSGWGSVLAAWASLAGVCLATLALFVAVGAFTYDYMNKMWGKIGRIERDMERIGNIERDIKEMKDTLTR